MSQYNGVVVSGIVISFSFNEVFPFRSSSNCTSVACSVASSLVVTIIDMSIAFIRDNASAIELSSSATCTMSVVNCAIRSSCLACRGDALSVRWWNAYVNGLWSVLIMMFLPWIRSLKYFTLSYAAKSSRSYALYFFCVGLNFF